MIAAGVATLPRTVGTDDDDARGERRDMLRLIDSCERDMVQQGKDPLMQEAKFERASTILLIGANPRRSPFLSDR